MGADRHLDWDGLLNARDLGGLPTATGETRWGAVVRSENPERLTAAGWAALRAYGIRTIVDLRNENERGADTAPRPPDLVTVQVPLEDYDGEPEFWQEWRDTGLWATPLYYQVFLDRFPRPVAAAVTAIATAGPGGVLVHCAAGKDRTGLVSLMLLALAGVAAEHIVADHTVSYERLRPLWVRLGVVEQSTAIAKLVADRGTTLEESLRATLAALDIEAYLLASGVSADDLAAVRTRLLSGGRRGEDPEVVA
jgi:protein-tyrosine phosphatase